MRTIPGALIAILISMSLACSTTGRKGDLSGTASDGSSAVAGVTVTVTSPAIEAPRTTTTDANGTFAMTDLPSGTYTVSFHADGFHPAGYIVQVTGGSERVEASLARLQPGEVPVVAPSLRISAVDASARGDQPARWKSRVEQAATGNFIGAPSATPMMMHSYREQESVEEYAAIAEGRFMEAKASPLSTFSIDVDRASYSNVRRFLSRGQLPPRDAVRIEELVNYFNYSYAPPADGKPFAVHTEVASCPWNEENRLLRIGIQGKQIDSWKMVPNNLVFLLDVSGSMQSPDKLPLVKDAFRLLVDQLRPQDRVSIVVYAGAAGTVLPPTSGADKQTILDAIEQLEAGGSTAGGEGILLAYDTARENFMRDGNNRVILATDGDFNVGVSSESELEELIVRKRREGVSLTVLGFGTGNLKDAKMELLADKGNGNYAYIDNELEAKKVFVQELGGTLVTIASDVKIQLDFNPQLVDSYRLVGYENRALENRDFDDDTKDAGELGAGHSVTALYEIRPAKGRVSSDMQLATLRLRYKDPGSETSQLIVTAVRDTRRSWYQASDDFKFASAVAQFGMLLRESEHRGTSNWSDAMQLAMSARGADLDGYRRELVTMLEQAAELQGRKTPQIVRGQ